MRCPRCGLALHGGDEAAVFLCLSCLSGYELEETGFLAVPVAVAAANSREMASGEERYLAFWRVFAQVTSGPDSAWRRLERRLQGEPCCFYIPGFSWRRVEVQQLGVRLTQTQPVLDRYLSPQGLAEGSRRLSGESTVFSVVLGRKDAQTLTHFIYLALEAETAEEGEPSEYEIKPWREELVLIPAVRDCRSVHDAGWRLLLREFDSLIA